MSKLPPDTIRLLSELRAPPRLQECSSKYLFRESKHIGRGNQFRSTIARSLHHVGYAKVLISQSTWCTDPEDQPELLSPLLEVTDYVPCLVLAKSGRGSIH